MNTFTIPEEFYCTWRKKLLHWAKHLMVVIPCLLLFVGANAQAEEPNTVTVCGFTVKTELTTNSPTGKTTVKWTITNTMPGNGSNGTYQDLSHWALTACFTSKDVYSANTGVSFKDPSQTCLTEGIFKFDEGTSGDAPKEYILILNGVNYSLEKVNAVFKSGNNSYGEGKNCCVDEIYGVACGGTPCPDGYTTTPTINPICPGSTVTGTAAPGANVVVTSGEQTESTTADGDGNWSVTFDNALEAGAQVFVTASEEGKCDASANETVRDYTTTPTINPICPGSTVTGTAAPGANVVVTSGEQTESTTADGDGNWSVTFDNALEAGAQVFVTASEEGKCDASASGEVKSTPTGTLSYTVPACKPVEGTSTISPTVTATSGGPFTIVSFSATTISGSGSLSINNTTGVIDLVASAAGTYEVTVSFLGANGCPGSAKTTITLSLCANSFTQGYWGGTSGNGKDCKGKTARDILATILPVTVGSANKYLRLNDASKTIAILPGGSYSQNVFDKKYALTSAVSPEVLLAGSKFLDSKTGKLVSVVISQTIALALNVKYDSRLGNIAFESGKNILNTKAVTYGTGCVVSSVATTSTAFPMSGKVLCYLQNNTATYGSFNVSGLLRLANAVIGGSLDVATGSPFSFSELVQTLDAINKGFDKGAQLVNYTGGYMCQQGAVTQVSVKTPVTTEETAAETIAISAVPNPFTDKIRFTIRAPKAGRATLEVYNMLGQKVGVPFEGQLSAGETRNVEYTAPVNFRSNLIYRLRMNGEQVSGKLMSTKQ